MAIMTLRHGSVAFNSADGTPIAVTLGPGVGDFQSDELEEGNKEAIQVLDRGDHHELVYGNVKQINGSINVKQDGALTSGSTNKPLDAVMKTGTFSSGTTRDAGAVVWTGDIVWTGTRAGVTATLPYTNCRLKASFTEGQDGNVLAISFVCYGGYTPA